MEDQVPFKVYCYWKDEQAEVRRFGVDKNVVTNYNYLHAKIQEVYPKLKVVNFSISWKDEDGDEVKMSSDEEVMTMLTALRDAVIKLYVRCENVVERPEFEVVIEEARAAFPGLDAATGAGVDGTHFGITCDGCGNSVVGFRYKCINCVDYDLCSQCEQRRVHPDHCVVRIPCQSLPRQVIRESIKKSRQFLKSVAQSAHEERKRGKPCRSYIPTGIPEPHVTPSMCSNNLNTHKETKQEEKKERHERREERREEKREERRERREQRSERPRRNWMDVFSKYIDEFANLAGDLTRAATEPAPSDFQSTQEGIINNTLGIDRNEMEKLIHACMSMREGTECPIIAINRELRKQAQTGSTQNQSGEASEAPAESQSETPANTDNEVPKTEDIDDAVSSTSGESVAVARDESPEKADDWTVINKEKDMDSDNAGQNASVDNLPEEFQTRARLSYGQLYPPLNTSTAVLNPKEVEVKPTAPAAAVPAPEPKPAAAAPEPNPTVSAPEAPPTPVPGSSRLHRTPHIDASIRQMIAMGFTNEGGWLTQLLESKDGNIAAVLDLLTPVNPKK